ncbi:iron-sulfur cluster-binding protein [Xanthomonas hortorum pv. carotae str. M081]|nr:iron-sulfur cluster-binding protein [Xanthomonas hortorum pv. carotae str. M081]
MPWKMHHPHITPGPLRQARQYIAIATVVAGAADHHDAACSRPAFQQVLPGGLPGALHQQVAIATEQRGGLRIQPARSGGVVKIERYVHAGNSILVAMSAVLARPDPTDAAARIRALAREAGFQRCGITGIELGEDEVHLRSWLKEGLYGTMHWMAQHGDKRSRPQELVPGTLRVLSVGMDYGRKDDTEAWNTLHDGRRAYVARYALGRDYHKLMRNRLQKLAERIQGEVGAFGYRVFVDSAPVLERALARNAGLGWIGKHTCLIDRNGGSWFFLGEIYLDLPLPIDTPATAHCGTCTRCIDICPTQAIIAPHRLDARRCIAYLTIEHDGAIPEEMRKPIGNRIFGCDDCQLVCPWNKFAQRTDEADFRARNDLDVATLPQLFAWDTDEFLRRTEGSPIRRSGHERWLRNIAVGLGNAPGTPEVLAALEARRNDDSELVREHVGWALAQHGL